MSEGAAREWSERQQAIFQAVEDDSLRHLVIEALAGSGKTTTIVEAMLHVRQSETVLAVAFNASIAEELGPRVPAGVEVRTLHSYGMRQVTASMRGREINRYATADAASEIIGRGWHLKEHRTFVSKLVSLGKGCLIGDAAGLDRLADDYDLRMPNDGQLSRSQLIAAAQRVLAAQSAASSGAIDFDDMIWLPIVKNLSCRTYGWVFVDETQDLNPAQLALVIRAAGDTGRIVAVGDRRQAIYGFRGADRQAIPRMITRLSAKVLPLSTTYRCGRAIVAEAQTLVPAIEAAPQAADGLVREASIDSLVRDAQPGDFVVSRTNAPLVSLCYRWIKAGRRAIIRGRDVGNDLATWVESTKATTIATLARAIDGWKVAEVRRLEELDRDTDAVVDRAECLHALCEGAETVGAVVERIRLMFGVAEKKDAGPHADAILLSSTHRAKGLEADRVWLLKDTYRPQANEEERNLLYVGITRAKRELVYVRKLPTGIEEPISRCVTGPAPVAGAGRAA